jgi:hypothetical protein
MTKIPGGSGTGSTTQLGLAISGGVDTVPVGYVGKRFGNRIGQQGATSLSSDGTILAAGEKYYDVGSDHDESGRVRVFNWDGSNWNQLGNDLLGGDGINAETSGGWFGTSVSLSSDGSRVAFGGTSVGRRIGANFVGNVGAVRIYDYVNSDWVQAGDDIYGLADGDYNGRSVSLSSDETNYYYCTHKYEHAQNHLHFHH